MAMNMNMIVVDKDSNEKYQVYDILYDNKSGYPQFLIYKDGMWIRMSAKYFRPQTTDDIVDELKNMNTSTLGVIKS